MVDKIWEQKNSGRKFFFDKVIFGQSSAELQFFVMAVYHWLKKS